MNRRMAAIAAAALTLALAPAPAWADEHTADPCASQAQQIERLTDQVAYQIGRADEANANASAQAVVAVERALAAEDRVERLTRELGARTAERDQLLVINNRVRAQRDRLRAKVAQLRARLEGALQS